MRHVSSIRLVGARTHTLHNTERQRAPPLRRLHARRRPAVKSPYGLLIARQRVEVRSTWHSGGEAGPVRRRLWWRGRLTLILGDALEDHVRCCRVDGWRRVLCCNDGLSRTNPTDNARGGRSATSEGAR